MRKASTSGTTTRLPRKQIRSPGQKKAVAVTPWYLLMPTMTRGPTGPLKMVLEHHGHMLSEILCCVDSPVVLGMAAQTCRGWRVAGEMAAQKPIGLMIHHYNVPAQMEESAIATWMQVLRPSLFVDAALMKAANLETPLLRSFWRQCTRELGRNWPGIELAKQILLDPDLLGQSHSVIKGTSCIAGTPLASHAEYGWLHGSATRDSATRGPNTNFPYH